MRNKPPENIPSPKKESESKVDTLQKRNAELAKAFAQSRQTEEKLNALIENADLFFMIVDKEGIIKFTSSNNACDTEWSPIDIEGMPLVEFVHKDDTATFIQTMKRLTETETGEVTAQFRFKCKSGTYLNCELEGRDLTGDARVDGYLICIKDISRRLAIEEEKAILTEELRQAQKMEAIGTLAGGIAHDFNNILQTMFGYLYVSLNRLTDEDDGREDLEEILKAAKRAKGLVQQILTFSRRVEHKKKPVDIYLIASETMHLIRSSLPATIEIIQRFDKTVGLVLANSTLIHQILTNLCTNSFHAMKETGGVLEVVLEPVTFDQPVKRDSSSELMPGEYVRLLVKDTGSGMDHETQKRIFEPFFTTKRPSDGTGLGLSVIHGIIIELGGRIRVNSELNKGSEFEILFPCAGDDVDSDLFVSRDAVRGSEKIIFVDDEESLVRPMKEALEEFGYRVSAHTGCDTVLKEFQEKPEKIDIVITNLAMPKMTGIELAAHLLRIRPDIPIILISGNTKPKFMGQTDKRGIRMVLGKPFTPEELGKAIRKVLSTD